MTNRWYGFIIIGLLLTGCAAGRTAFRVIQPTPQPTPVISTGEKSGPFLEQPDSESSSEMLKNEQVGFDQEQVHIVRKGDTLWFITEMYLGDPKRYPELAQRNQIVDPDLILPGQQIHIKGGERKLFSRSSKKNQILTPKPQTIVNAIKPISKDIKPIFPERSNKAFSPGEQLLFSVEYFGIAAGFATLSVKKGPLMHGRETLHLVATARTHPAFEWIFKVRDTIESYIDKKGLFSWQYEKHLREGNYKNDSVLEYDQLNRKVIKEGGKKIVDAPPWTQDVISVFYYFRTLPLRVGETLTIDVVADDAKTYQVIVKAVREEKITVPSGTFDCLVLEPKFTFEGLFKHEGDLHMWVTNDERKVPVLIKSKIVIGSINIVLRDAVVVDVN